MRVTRLMTASGWAGLVAMIAATAALAQTAPAAVYCLNGTTTTLPAPVSFAGGTALVTESVAEFMITRSFDRSTFYVGVSATTGAGPFLVSQRPPPFDHGTILAPGYSTNTVSRGACIGGVHPVGPGSAFMCGSAYGALSGVDYISGREAVGGYLAGETGRRYASFVLGDLSGAQQAQPIGTAAPSGSFYCALPAGLRVEAITGADGRQLLADTQGTLYPSEYANMETIGHPAYRLAP